MLEVVVGWRGLHFEVTLSLITVWKDRHLEAGVMYEALSGYLSIIKK